MHKVKVIGLVVTMVLTVLSLIPLTVYAQVSSAEAQILSARYLAAGIGFGLAALGAGLGIGIAGASSVSALVERRELFALALVFVALAEAIAIYGLIVFFLLY